LCSKPKNIKNKVEYATVKMISSKTYAVIDSANQCLFATDTLKKANNFLARLLKNAGY